MSAFTLDTSGCVEALPWQGIRTRRIYWSDLTPFQQGYVEALLLSLGECVVRRNGMDERDEFDHAGFSDLAPEALALILKDCAAFTGGSRWPASSGETFWRDRHNGDYAVADGGRHFPPLTVTLGDDGKVHLTPSHLHEPQSPTEQNQGEG